ncbi:MAG: purine-binding chemotaxis protein CheW [Phycisphaerae bacterium]|nr:purine-binding chemotaxis protein CheW [Phycisphaerae bacterium]
MEAEPENSGTQTTVLGGKYLTFSLAGEEYGLEILKVREIIGIMDITALPRVPPAVKGVINLRGKVIPVLDLRLKFGLEPAEYTDETCIVVVDVGSLVGVIVDTVQEVLDIADEQIDPPPPLGAAVDTTFVLGMGKVKDAVKILLDIDQVLRSDEMTSLLESVTDDAG